MNKILMEMTLFILPLKNHYCFFFLQINSNLEAAAQLNWASGSSSTSFQVGCKYDIDKDTSIRVGENSNKS